MTERLSALGKGWTLVLYGAENAGPDEQAPRKDEAAPQAGPAGIASAAASQSEADKQGKNDAPGEQEDTKSSAVVASHPFSSCHLAPRGAPAPQCTRQILTKQDFALQSLSLRSNPYLRVRHAHALPIKREVKFRGCLVLPTMSGRVICRMRP